MLAFTVNDTKSFMNLLLKGDTFDAFSFRQGELTTFASFIIEGKRNMDFYTAEEQEAGLSRYVHWEEMRPFVFQAIKGSCRKASSLCSPLRRKSLPISPIPRRHF